MRAHNTALLAAAVLAAAPTLAQNMGGGMKGMSSMDNMAPAVKTGKGVGVITAIDPKAAKLTIKHGPIPTVGWPAMSMTFAATPPALLKGLKVGQRIAFDVRTKGGAGEVTAVRPQ
jgi:Cu(I)/Ag(I) efflux system protein CusF